MEGQLMNWKKNIVPALWASLPSLLPQIVEYLGLEENQNFYSDELSLIGYFTAEATAGFLVFEYSSEEGRAIAFVQHALGERIDDGCIGCWPRTEGRTIEWSLGEYLDYNPL
jgi:hypothetical protein